VSNDELRSALGATPATPEQWRRRWRSTRTPGSGRCGRRS
jgi:hypothetical protein